MCVVCGCVCGVFVYVCVSGVFVCAFVCEYVCACVCISLTKTWKLNPGPKIISLMLYQATELSAQA